MEKTYQDIEVIDSFVNQNKRKTVVVQGLGFVGTAVIAALANAKDENNNPLYNVIGTDLPDRDNLHKIDCINKALPPADSSDNQLNLAYKNAKKNKNLMATCSEYAYTKADIVMVDINLDISKGHIENPFDYTFSYQTYKEALAVVAQNIKQDTLVVIETTVPPGTTEKIIYPLFKEIFEQRGLDIDRLYLAFSYERVMPGAQYLDSITNFYRVYSGINKPSKQKAAEFLQSFINTRDYPLFELDSPTAAEMAKILENSYRAVNIAFIREWTAFAQKTEVDLFEIINAIRVRPTHSNIMAPGLGVGGYCLPKDPLLADWAYTNLFAGEENLTMSLNAVAINDMMPDYAFELLKDQHPDLKNAHITILGVSYRSDVADTRNCPTGLFYDRSLQAGAIITLYDDFVSFWKEKNLPVETQIDALRDKPHDVVVFAVKHKSCLQLSTADITSIFKGVKIVLDANNVINDKKAKELFCKGIKVIGIGKGHWKKYGKADQ